MLFWIVKPKLYHAKMLRTEKRGEGYEIVFEITPIHAVKLTKKPHLLNSDELAQKVQ